MKKQKKEIIAMTSYNLKPLADRVVVKPSEAEEVSKGGIILPDTAQEKPQEGTIVSVGPGRTTNNGVLVSLTVTEGARVIYGKYSGTEVEVDGDKLLIMKEDDILATYSDSRGGL